jgi:hypothetical protein
MEALELLAKSFELSCDMPHVTLVVVWDKSVCGIDSWWKTDDQARILEGLLRQDGIPVGWIGMDENLDPLAVIPLEGELPESLERQILIDAHKAKTGRGIRWMRRNTEFTDAVMQHAGWLEQIEAEWTGFLSGMLSRVQKGGRP